jgi:hypothetical protein
LRFPLAFCVGVFLFRSRTKNPRTKNVDVQRKTENEKRTSDLLPPHRHDPQPRPLRRGAREGGDVIAG